MCAISLIFPFHRKFHMFPLAGIAATAPSFSPGQRSWVVASGHHWHFCSWPLPCWDSSSTVCRWWGSFYNFMKYCSDKSDIFYTLWLYRHWLKGLIKKKKVSKPCVTLARWVLIHFVKVRFCTDSCSSGNKRKSAWLDITGYFQIYVMKE